MDEGRRPAPAVREEVRHASHRPGLRPSRLRLAGPRQVVRLRPDLNRIYRVDRITGEVSSCQYGLHESSVGVTLCFGPGEGAAAQPPAEYGLVASRHEREGGVFRVNYRTGEMSICYVFEEKVVCTPPDRGPHPTPVAGTGRPAGPDTAAAGSGATRRH